MSVEEENEILKYIVNALLARSEGVLVINMDEVQRTYQNSFKYECTENAILVERT